VFVRQLGYGCSSAVPFNQAVASTVIVLLNVCHPSAVIRSVSLAVVNAVDGMCVGWTLPHVGHKHIEIITPSIAYGNAATAVVFVVLVSWAIASAVHAFPGNVLRRSARSVGFVPTTGHFGSKAPTRLRLPLLKYGFVNHPDRAAFTAAQVDVIATQLQRMVNHYRPAADANATQIVHGEPPSKVIRNNAGRAVMSRLFAVATPLASGHSLARNVGDASNG
jgi:hypothetical protein